MQSDRTINLDQRHIDSFETHLKLERSLSENTISSYLLDIEKLRNYLEHSLVKASAEDIMHFLVELESAELSKRSIARIISGLKTFYKFMMAEDVIKHSPLELIETPKLPKHLPEVLTHEEIMGMIAEIDLSKPSGERDKTIVMLMYSCGLRVSELLHQKINDIYTDEGFIKVLGKGNKERLVPIGKKTLEQIGHYLQYYRSQQKVKRGCLRHLF